MKIGKKTPTIRRERLRWVMVWSLVFVSGFIAGQLIHWSPSSITSAVSSLRRYRAGGELPTLFLDIDFQDYSEILAQREQALRLGAYIPKEADFVAATIRLNDSLTQVRIRLLAGPAENLGEDDKWGFSVRIHDDGRLLDMQRFTLIDPTRNNGLRQWAFAQALAREDILVARYHLVHLVFNGADRGVYAVQEGFGAELLEAQDRSAGVIIEFDADQLWESAIRFDGDLDAVFQDPVTNMSADDFQFMSIDAFRDASIAEDPALSAQRDEAIHFLRNLQMGKLTAAEVFDVERYGRFLALVDLWGATEATALVNLRYYYNPTTGLLEPISYNGNPLNDNSRISLSATYHDPVIQSAYALAVSSLIAPDYLIQLQAELEPEWQRLRAALPVTIEETLDPWGKLIQRQNILRHSLEPIQPIFAFLSPREWADEGILRVDVANAINLPLVILGFDIDGVRFVDIRPEWLHEPDEQLLLPEKVMRTSMTEGLPMIGLRSTDKNQATPTNYVQFHIPLAAIQDLELDFRQEIEVSVATQILGLDERQLTRALPGLPKIRP